MTRTVNAPPDLRPLPRFTFAGRGCRDPRREPRRRPGTTLTGLGPLTAPAASALPGPAISTTSAAPATSPSPSPAARKGGATTACAGRAAPGDRPPPSTTDGEPWPNRRSFTGMERKLNAGWLWGRW